MKRVGEENEATHMTRTRTALGYLIAMSILSGGSGLAVAATTTVSAVIPWQGQGQIFSVGAEKLRFLGSIEGIMYVETAEGAMDEAFVQCPIVQDIDAITHGTSATGTCTIIVSTEDIVFAEITCVGIEGLCIGDFILTGGTGRFIGISGSGRMTVRSPIHVLAANLSESAVLQVAAGILQMPELEITLP
jgi:hypothetical protein